MRWRGNFNYGPWPGDLRIRRYFAFFPVTVGGFKVWLEFYYCVEECFHVYGGTLGGKWNVKYRGFQKEDCFHFLSNGYEPLTFLGSKNLFRTPPHGQDESPWYGNQSV